MHTHARLVIIGAGIVGCSAAYHLARLGWRDVVVLDGGPLFETGGSTSHAPGLVFQTNPSRTMCLLAQESVRLYNDIAHEGQPGFLPVGSLEVAGTAERAQDLKRRWGLARAWGLDAALLSPGEARDLLPLLDADAIHSAFYVPSDGLAKAVRACTALGRAAQEGGVAFYGETEVTGIEVAGGHVRAVQTSRGRIEAEALLLCAGIWGPQVGRLAGLSIPLTPVEHQYVWTTPLHELAGATAEATHPILRHQDRAMYFRQHGDCYGVGSYQHEPLLVAAATLGRPAQVVPMPSVRPFTPEHFERPWADATALLPALGVSEPARGINGMFSFTPDGLPLLGESTQVRGLWVAEAVWVTHGGGVGRAVAEWLDGGEPPLDLRECLVSRFEAHAHSPAYVRARGAQQYREVYDIIHPLQQMEQPRPLRTSPFYPRQQALGAVFFEGRGWERAQWYAREGPRTEDRGPRTENQEPRTENRGPNADDGRWTEDHRQQTADGRSLTADNGSSRVGDGSQAILHRPSSIVRPEWSARNWSPHALGEHLATRERVGLFDMTALTRLELWGPGTLGWLQSLATGQLDRPVGSVVYTLLCTEGGGVRSDITVARLGHDRFHIGCNGPHDVAWLRQRLPTDGSVALWETTAGSCGVGVWGPLARQLVTQLSDDDWSNEGCPYLAARELFVGEVPCLALRLSYVGELGWELYTSADYGLRLWDLLWAAGQPLGVVAAGRAAFDSLRIEKGYRLWGQDMHSEYTPYEAGLGFAVKLDKGPFIGQEALRRLKGQAPARKLCCLLLDDPDVVLLGKEPLLADGAVVGYVTSAAYGPSVGRSIAYGYLPANLAHPGTRVEAEFFGQRHGATVAREPLFDPKGARLRG